MPTPSRTSLADIVAEGRRLLEAEGPAGLTMQAVAHRVGVRAPSLYKRVASRDQLLRLIAEATIAELRERLDDLDAGADPRRQLAELLSELRDFARANPAVYALIFTAGPDASRPDRGALDGVIAPIFDVVGRLSKDDHPLEGARLVTAWVHGFITMEAAGAFQLGGDVNEAFEFGLDRLARALAADAR